MDIIIPLKRTAAHLKGAAVAAKRKFTRIPKIPNLVQQGVPTEVIPTYCALADHANNKTGLCWPKMETLASILNRSVRTIQRHLHLLQEKGLIEFVNRRRYKGRFGSYLYKVFFIATTGHGKPVDRAGPNKRRTKHSTNTPKPPVDLEQKRKEEAKRRQEGYEWLFE